MDKKELIEKIIKFKKNKSICIAADYNEPVEIENIADFRGNTEMLYKNITNTNCKIIVVCGPLYLAENLSVLLLDRSVYYVDTPNITAFYKSVSPVELNELRQLYPSAKIIVYIKSSMKIKILADYICTAGNILETINNLPDKQFISLPDYNISRYLSTFSNKEIITAETKCSKLKNIDYSVVKNLIDNNPGSILLVHPECNHNILNLTSGKEILSSAGMIDYIKKNTSKRYLICNGANITASLKKMFPEKKFISPLKKRKRLTGRYLKNIYNCILHPRKKVSFPDEIANKIKNKLHFT